MFHAFQGEDGTDFPIFPVLPNRVLPFTREPEAVYVS